MFANPTEPIRTPEQVYPAGLMIPKWVAKWYPKSETEARAKEAERARIHRNQMHARFNKLRGNAPPYPEMIDQPLQVKENGKVEYKDGTPYTYAPWNGPRNLHTLDHILAEPFKTEAIDYGDLSLRRVVTNTAGVTNNKRRSLRRTKTSEELGSSQSRIRQHNAIAVGILDPDTIHFYGGSLCPTCVQASQRQDEAHLQIEKKFPAGRLPTYGEVQKRKRLEGV